MKKIIKAVTLLSLVLTFLFVNAACDDNGGKTEPPKNQESEIYYTVTFDTDGGTTIESQTVKAGEKAVKPQKNPTKITTGSTTYKFIGWYVRENEYDFNAAVTGNLTIKAKWQTDSYSGWAD